MTVSALEWSPPSEFDEYRLVRPLGRGAMGQVYLARDLALDRLVAIKLIAAVDPDPVARQRFLTEARAIARLQHPNVVAVHRIGEVARRPYLVSEYVSGEGLDRLPKPVPWQRALDIGIDLARGLAAAHRRGVLHRDIKPANSMITSDGVAKLLDFGLAKLLDDASEAPASEAPAPRISDARVDTSFAATQTSPAAAGSDQGSPELRSPSGQKGSDSSGDMVGTPLYMAPEIWLGLPASRRSDVFSLGVLLYELVAGKQPRRRPQTLEELKRMITSEDATPLSQHAPGVHAGLAAVIMRCLRRDPAERWDGGDALCTALEQVRAGTRAGELPAGNPYRGLAPFDAEHRSLFFGRSAEVREVVDRLRFEPFVLVAGDSGVGKSSLCRAGVLPALRDGAAGETPFRVFTLFPGRKPFSELVMLLALESGVARDFSDIAPDELARQLGRAILFVDQLEEVVTVAEPDEAARFAEALAALAASRAGTRLLATVRGDFATRLAALPALGQHVSRALYILRPLDEEGLRDAVTGPARAKGFELESQQMVDSLVASSGGGLPLLQFTLAALWEQRDQARRVIPARALDDIGGVEGALARHADAAIDAMLPAERPAAWRALDRLVTHEGTRAVMTRAELDSVVAEAPQVVERLVAACLLVAAEERISLVHEALVTAWPRLVTWRREHAEGAHLRDQIGDAARQWDSRGRPRGLLWRDEALAEYRLWRARHDHKLTAVEEAFAGASLADAVRIRRRRNLAISFAFAALAVGVVVLLYFNRQAARARAQAEDRLAKLHLEQGREAFLAGSSMNALVYLREANRLGVDSPASRLLGHLARRSIDAQQLKLAGHRGIVRSVAWSPDGSTLATAGQDGTARIWDAASGRERFLLAGHKGDVMQVRFSPDGASLLTVGIDTTARLWDARTGRVQAVLAGHTGQVETGAFSPDGSKLVTAGQDGTPLVWSRSGTLVAKLAGHNSGNRVNQVFSAVFSPDGARIVTAGFDGTARVWDAATGAQVLALEPKAGKLWRAELDPSGGEIVTAGADRSARVWDARTGLQRLALLGHSDEVRGAWFSPDGATVITVSQDRTANLWDARTGALRATLIGHNGFVLRAAFSADGRRVLTSSRDGTIRLWEVDGGAPVATFEGHSGPIFEAAFGPDGRIATAGADGTARVWSTRGVETSRLMERYPGDDVVADVALCAHEVNHEEPGWQSAWLSSLYLRFQSEIVRGCSWVV